MNQANSFSRIDKVDVKDRIAYMSSCTHNLWDPTLMLANVIFYLHSTTRIWLEMHEDKITSWDLCKPKLILLVKLVGRQPVAKTELSSQAQI